MFQSLCNRQRSGWGVFEGILFDRAGTAWPFWRWGLKSSHLRFLARGRFGVREWPCCPSEPLLNQRKETFWIFLTSRFCVFSWFAAPLPCRVLWESRPLCRRLWERPRPHLSPVTNQWQPSESWPPGSPLGPALEQWEASLADKGLLPALTCCLKSNRGNPFIPYSSGPLPSQFVLGKVAVGGRGAPAEGGGGNGNGGAFGFVVVFLFPFHNSLAGACGAGLTKPPQSAWSPAGLLTVQVCCVYSYRQYSWAQRRAPALGKYFYSFPLITLRGGGWDGFERWEGGKGNLHTWGRAKQRWVEGDLSPASVIQAFKGSLCQSSASTLKLEGLGGISVGSEGGERGLGRRHVMVWVQPVSFMFFLLGGDISWHVPSGWFHLKCWHRLKGQTFLVINMSSLFLLNCSVCFYTWLYVPSTTCELSLYF